jgi:hypothetical protein
MVARREIRNAGLWRTFEHADTNPIVTAFAVRRRESRP